MMKMRVALFLGLLAVVCLSVSSVRAEDPKAEPESEPEAEPEGHDHKDHKDEDGQSGSVSKSGQAKAATGKNSASAAWAFSVPAMITMAAVAKFVL